MPPPASSAQTRSPTCQDEPAPTSLITPEHSRPNTLLTPGGGGYSPAPLQ